MKKRKIKMTLKEKGRTLEIQLNFLVKKLKTLKQKSDYLKEKEDIFIPWLPLIKKPLTDILIFVY